MSEVLGKLVRARRKSYKLTQQQLGELGGTGTRFVSELEAGKETVRLDKVLAILKVLGVKVVLVPGKNSIELGEAFQ